MHPLTELRRLLTARAGRRTGTVQTVADGRAEVVTAAGVQTVPLAGVAASAGDRVVIEQGAVVGRLSGAAPRVYEV